MKNQKDPSRVSAIQIIQNLSSSMEFELIAPSKGSITKTCETTTKFFINFLTRVIIFFIPHTYHKYTIQSIPMNKLLQKGGDIMKKKPMKKAMKKEMKSMKKRKGMSKKMMRGMY